MFDRDDSYFTEKGSTGYWAEKWAVAVIQMRVLFTVKSTSSRILNKVEIL